MKYIVRKGMSQKISSNDELYLLNEYLKRNYDYIYDSMKNEGFDIRFEEFLLFSEIIFENKVVGFASYKFYDSMNLTLMECYVLPEFRGNHLFFEEIMGMMLTSNSLSIQQPPRKIVEMLIHYRLAEKLNDNLVASGLSFDISHEHLLKYGNPIVEGDICSSLLYDLNLCSPLYLADISTQERCDIAYQKCLKQDIDDYRCDEFRNSTDLAGYFAGFKMDFLKNHKSFEKVLMEINKRLSGFKNEFSSSSPHFSDILAELVDGGIVGTDESLQLAGQIQKELDEGIINDESISVRINYLVEGNDLSKDKERLLENLSMPQYLCPYCYQPINLRDSFCNTCGHTLSKNEYLMPDKIMSELQSEDAVVVDLRGDKFIEKHSDGNLVSSSREFHFDDDRQCLKLLEIYRNGDEVAFSELKEEYDLPIDDIEEIGLLDSSVPMEFPMYGITYFKNFYTSTLLIDLDKPINKHTLDGSVEFRVGDVPDNYTYYLYMILSGLKENPNLLEVIESQGLNKNTRYPFNLFSEEYIESQEYGDRIYGVLMGKFKVKELKDILRKHGLKVSGNKDDLIIRLLENNLFHEFGVKDFILTSKGETALRRTSWVNTFMTNMDYFDFDDFLDFLIENKSYASNFERMALRYLNHHLKIAYENKDFHRLHDVYASRALCHMQWEDIKKALKDELTLFIIRLNPIFLDDGELKSYNPIEFSNVHNISELVDYCNIHNFKKLFNKSWSEIRLEKRLVSKKMSLNYLNKAITGYNLEELSDEIKNRYY